MNSNKIINWGIIGCGSIAKKFAQDLQEISNANLYAVSSRSAQKAKKFANQYGAETYYGNYEALSLDPKVDVVYIATPHVLHYENTIMCLTHKKAILCEKPFAINKTQVSEMINLAKQNNVFLMEALWTHFLPHYKFVLNHIQSGKLGMVKKLHADFGFVATFNPDGRLFNKNLGGGSLLDLGIYPLFVALSTMGYPTDIQASAQIGSTGVDETCSIELSYKNGATASLFSAITQDTNTEAIIELEHGTIHIHSPFYAPSSVTIICNGQSKEYKFDVLTNGYHYEALHVQEMLLQNKTESTVMTFEKSLQIIQLLDTVREKIGLYY